MKNASTPNGLYRRQFDFINEIKMSDPIYTSQCMTENENSDRYSKLL